MSRYIVLLAFILTGCGKLPPAPELTIDPQLKPYFERFCAEVGGDCSTVSGEFADLGSTYAGMCNYTNPNSVQINAAYWERINDEDKEEVVFHELGHCLLGLGHDSRHLPDGCPASIMYPSDFGWTGCYTKHRAEYVAALRARA